MQQLTIRYFAQETYCDLVDQEYWPQAIHVVLDLDSQTLLTNWDAAYEGPAAVSVRCSLRQAGQRLPTSRRERVRELAKVVNALLDQGRVLAQPTSGQTIQFFDLPGRLTINGGCRE